MSDTDDTDDLLLIPPDFFGVHSDVEDSAKGYGPYYKVVDSLITQVNKLENRIINIETASDSSFVSNSLDSFINNNTNQTNLMSGIRKCNSLENLSPQQADTYLPSTSSTPQKPRTRLKLNSLPSTPSTDRYTPRRYRISDVQNRQNDRLHSPQFSYHNKFEPRMRNEMLNEIDNFISNVKTIKKFHAARDLNPQFDILDSNEKMGSEAITKSRLNLSDVDQMLHEMESHQRQIDSRLKETKHELDVSRKTIEPKGFRKKWQSDVNNMHALNDDRRLRNALTNELVENAEDRFQQEKLWKQGEIKGSVPDRGMGMRDAMYNEQSNNTEKQFHKDRLRKPGESKNSVPDRGMGMRDILYNEMPNIEEPFHKENIWKESTAPNHRLHNNDHFINVENSHRGKRWKQDQEKNSPQNYDVGVLYCEAPKDGENYKTALEGNDIATLTVIAPPSTLDSARNTESIYTDNSSSPSSSDTTQLTAYQNRNLQDIGRGTTNTDTDYDKISSNAMQVLNMHKNLLHNSVKSSSVDDDNEKQNRLSNSSKRSIYSYKNIHGNCVDYEPSGKNTLALLSLSELWNSNVGGGDLRNHDRSKFLNKLQEEKLRRQHCEQLIQQLQTRTLELQERLAVAVQVDHAKDNAILRIHKSWEEAATKIDGLSGKNSGLEQQVAELKANISLELAEATKKVNHYESEASKALNLAHSSQEKVSVLEKQIAQLTTELKNFESKLKVAQDNYNSELDRAHHFSKLTSQKEIELNENKHILSEARKEVSQSKKAVEICQTELTAMRSTQTQLELQLNQEFNRGKEFEKEKKRFLAEIERHKKIEKTLQEDLDKQKDMNEKNKLELRNFYQDQVEIVVREKLQEFQSQLEKAENSLQDEVHKRELAVAKAAAVHIQQCAEKHSLEVHLLEEKHKEEVKLYKLKLTHVQQQIENLQIKFHQHQERRSSLAHQLHKVMESQWLEVLKIINNNNKSPTISQDKSTNTLDQLNFLKSKSYNNVEELLLKDEQGAKASGDLKIRKSNMPFFQSFDSMSSTIDDDTHGNIEQSMETPLTSRSQKNRQQIDNELQKYVQMLLNKSPGNPTDEQNSKNTDKAKTACSNNYLDNNEASNIQWQQFNQEDRVNSDGTKSNKIGPRERLGKPPWK